MAYSTQTDLLEQIDEDILIQLTDDVDAGTIDADKVTRAIADADGEIDSYCGMKYPVPFTTVPPVIRKCSVDIGIYNLYSRRKGAPEDRKTRYDNAIRFLKDVAKGLASLGEDDPNATPGGSQAPDIDQADRIFTRDKMKGF